MSVTHHIATVTNAISPVSSVSNCSEEDLIYPSTEGVSVVKQQQTRQLQLKRRISQDSICSSGPSTAFSSNYSQNSSDYGWYDQNDDTILTRDNDMAAAVSAPTYVLEESIANQRLWKHTAGQRPPQPDEERNFYEKLWADNFSRSEVEYAVPVSTLSVKSSTTSGANAAFMSTESTPQKGAVCVSSDSSDGELLSVSVRGDNVFGTTVSKSFARSSSAAPADDDIRIIDTVNISIASYRVVESKNFSKQYAQFLVIYREGSFHDTVGVWKRFSDFSNLSKVILKAHEKGILGCGTYMKDSKQMEKDPNSSKNNMEHFPNSITSWQLLKRRRRWYRCLDAGYLSLKVFLLERFLHDILFESSSPDLLREFVGVNV